MAAKKTTKSDSIELSKNLPAKTSAKGDTTEPVQINSIDSLKARFGVAEEDASIRNEGFELAKTGGLIRRPKPEAIPMYAEKETTKIPTDSGSELSKVFDSAKSEHDNDNVYFSDLEIKKEESKEEKPVSEEIPEKPKRRPGRPRKVPAVEEPAAEEKSDSDEEITTVVKKYNTHTKVIFVDESLDDGIKRNSDSELEELFVSEEKGRKSKLWSRRKK